MFYLLCLVLLGAGVYLYNFGVKQKSTVVKLGAAVVSLGAIVLIIVSAIFGYPGKGHFRDHMGYEGRPMCQMMEMHKGGCMSDMNRPGVEVQRPPMGPEKYHQPPRHLMTDPMESQPKK